jgi:hypothetical protein
MTKDMSLDGLMNLAELEPMLHEKIIVQQIVEC